MQPLRKTTLQRSIDGCNEDWSRKSAASPRHNCGPIWNLLMVPIWALERTGGMKNLNT
jgi:hypothetical protein